MTPVLNDQGHAPSIPTWNGLDAFIAPPPPNSYVEVLEIIPKVYHWEVGPLGGD